MLQHVFYAVQHVLTWAIPSPTPLLILVEITKRTCDIGAQRKLARQFGHALCVGNMFGVLEMVFSSLAIVTLVLCLLMWSCYGSEGPITASLRTLWATPEASGALASTSVVRHCGYSQERLNHALRCKQRTFVAALLTLNL